MKLSGFHVSIHSDGEKLEEHSIETSPDGKKVTCWIPSQGGKEFVVKFRDGESSTNKAKGKSVHVYMDGKRLVKRVSLPHQMCGQVGGMRISENVKRSFTFADIRTTDEDEVPGSDDVKLDKIGTISIRVFVVEKWQALRTTPRHKIKDHPPVLIHERAKKAGQHCVSLGVEKPSRAGTSYTSDYDSRKPDLVFEFCYRPMPVLQALGIIPLLKREAPSVIELEDTPPPPKRQKASPDEDLVQSMQVELERLRRRVGELEEGAAGPSGVKHEKISIKYDPGDIIDLT